MPRRDLTTGGAEGKRVAVGGAWSGGGLAPYCSRGGWNAMRWAVVALIGLTLAAGPVGAEVVCRPNSLGSVSCPDGEPRPMARPGGPSVQALDRVRDRMREPADEDFIPARRTNRLGGTVRREGGWAGICRADTLGNLHCR
jgi:hypothetical protein